MQIQPFLPKSLLLTVLLLIPTTACQTGDSNHMNESHQQQMQQAYEAMQKEYKNLLRDYEQDSASMPEEMKNLYAQMQQMHRNMDKNHGHMMSGHRQRGMHGDDKQGMMGGQMHMQMQNRMTGEWYHQMQGMHQQMAQMHQQRNQSGIAEKHQQMAKIYGEMMNLLPNGEQSQEEPFNKEGDPAMLNGKNLYLQNCASCHGNNAQGIGNVFPPLVDSEWITGNKSVPIRIVRDGLRGEIEVKGQTYTGNMPSFKARLSIAEIAAIINYLRDVSDGNYSQITQNDVIEIVNSYEKRNTPWNAEELSE